MLGTAPIISGGNLHFPKDIVKKFEVKKGDLFAFLLDENNELIIKKANP
jgi:hypothetical protein